MAFALPTTTRQSARVIPHPHPAPQPVQQQRGPGRRPKNSNVISLGLWRRDRAAAPRAAAYTEAQDDLARAAKFVAACETVLATARAEYVQAQHAAKAPARSPAFYKEGSHV